MAEENEISVSLDASSPKNLKKPSKELEREDITTLHERTIAALSYISFFAIIPFYLKEDSEFCRFHGKQGMLLCIMFFIASILSVINVLFDFLLIVQVFTFFFMGFKALSGRWKKLPLFYDWACQLEDVLSLKTKEEEIEAIKLKPNEVRSDASANQTRPNNS